MFSHVFVGRLVRRIDVGMADCMPDLSHLSAEERAIIEEVFQRQKQEEATEKQIEQRADQELDNIEKQISDRKQAAARLVGTQDDAICQICQVTKFADGIGHKCFYCQLRSCARCGGRTQSKGKPIWACSMCQKKQSILAKTGKWFQQEKGLTDSPMEGPTPSTSSMNLQATSNGPMDMASTKVSNALGPGQQPMQQLQQQQTPSPMGMQQQPGMMQPMQQQHPSPMAMQHAAARHDAAGHAAAAAADDGTDGTDHDAAAAATAERSARESSVQQRRGPYGDGRRQGTMNRQGSVESSGAYRQDANGSVGRGDGMMRKGQRREERPVFYTDSADLAADGNMTPLRKTSHRPRPPGSDLTIDEQYGGQGSSSGPGPSPHSAHSTRAEFRRTRSIRQDENNRRGSISARLQEVAPVPPASATGVRKKKSQLHRQMRSMSSSDEESQQPSTATGQQSQSQLQHMQQQPGYQQATDAMGRGCDPRIPRDDLQRLPQECTSEKDLLRYIYGNDLGRGANGKRRQQMERARSVEERYPPTATRRPFSAAGFTPSYGRGGVMAGDALAKTIRNFLSQPVSWQPSADGRRLIGHIVLYRADTMPSGDLGLKVIGGRRSETGRLGAFVTQVRTGSVADTIGKLRAGDEVLEWNGQVLENATYDRVYEVISGSKHDQQVELIVSRSASIVTTSEVADYTLYTPPGLSPNLSGYGMQSHHHQLLPHSQSAILPSSLLPHGSPHKSSVPMYYGSSFYNPAPMLPLQLQRGQIFGRIEIALYYSVQDRELTVKVIRALDLSPRPDGIPRSPYCKLFLLPDRSEKSRRQSDVLAETAMPFWDKSFYYRGLGDEDLLERVLEVTLWDYDKFEANSFLGEVLIDFTETPLDGQPLLYTLVDMDDENPLRMRLRERRTMAITPRRPHSEIGHYGAYRQGGHHNHHHHPLDTMEPLIDYPYDRAIYDERQYSDNTMRRSRTYDRAGGRVEDDRRRGEGPPLSPSPRGGVDTEDWTLQKQNSGYLSDYGYAQAPPQATRYKQRRPRSATALRLTQDQMSASRMYNRYLPDEPPPNPDDPPDLARLGISARMDPRSPNGRVMASESAGGYGSDGSETLSAHSNHSVPIVRTINRRRTPEDIMAEEQEERRRERNHHSRDDDSQRGRSSEKGGNGTDMQSMKERKKSLMTRFIPGKGAAAGKRTGFARSEEVGIPSALGGQPGSIGGGGSGTSLESRLQAPFLKQTSKESTDSSYSDNWPPVVPDGQLGSFIDNLGPGQVVGRQVLASPVLGEIHLGIAASRSGIDVEVLQAKNLVVKPGIKICPAPYVKVYLMEGKTCVAKAKTNAVRKTTNPLFQQHLIFSESPRNKMLQVTVLGDYGRMERKAFMGIAQIRLDDLQLGPEPLIGLYKLFHSSSLAGTGPIRKDSETSLADPAQ
ncbi:unc-10 [Pristionchus pacificus]|uniref:Unc-10 n=1 Tax=Pristionchus pacificus TaxID=54126 RepID=A0A2A6BF71_PRIPA|nr:unc-10 [Pristionchus pacificus]|eukprot:PDM64529.1 unc-10 [Pristionchus pacificus]